MAAWATKQAPTQHGRGQLLAVGSTGAKKANARSHVELYLGTCVYVGGSRPWVQLSARGRALVGGEEMLVATRMQDRGALRPMLVSMIFSGSCATTRELSGIVPRMTHRPRG